jgi:hypothetical protein
LTRNRSVGFRVVRTIEAAPPSTSSVAPPGNAAPLTGPELFRLLTDDEQWQWSASESLGPHINTKANELAPAVSGDGLLLVFHCGDRGAVRSLGEWDLWMCRRTSVEEPFSAPENLGPDINSAANDMYPWLSLDGLTLVFGSLRDGTAHGGGAADLWISTRASRDAQFGPATMMPGVNSGSPESSGALTGDGRVIVFSSYRSGNDDLWQAVRSDPLAPFGKSVRLGDEINAGSHKKFDPWLSADGQLLVYTGTAKPASTAEANPSLEPSGMTLWAALRPDVHSPFAERKRVAVPVSPKVKIGIRHAGLTADGRLLYFEAPSDAGPGGAGGLDLWVARRLPR